MGIARKKGIKAAGSAVWHGTVRSYTGIFQLDDMQRCGESTMVWAMTLSPALKKIPSPFRGGAGEAVAATASKAGIAGKIAGYTKHGIEQAILRDNHGVSPQAILDAVRSPLKVISQPERGTVLYVGKSAVVSLNKAGKVVTTWATNKAGWRY